MYTHAYSVLVKKKIKYGTSLKKKHLWEWKAA